MRIYTKTGAFKSTADYHLRCEYCDHERSVTATFEHKVEVQTLNRPPTLEEFEAEKQRVRKAHQDRVLANAQKGGLPLWGKTTRCPECGFLPTVLIKKGQTVWLLLGMLFVGIGLFIPLFIPGAMSDPTLVVVLGSVCYLPYLLAIGYLIYRLNPNRRLLRALKNQNRQLANPEPPHIDFGPMMPK